MAVSGMNHFTILTDDVDATVNFYRDLLGLVAGERPDLGFPGAWLYAGPTQTAYTGASETSERTRGSRGSEDPDPVHR